MGFSYNAAPTLPAQILMTLLALGINHKTAPVALREKVAFTPDSLVEALASLKKLEGVDESVIVSPVTLSYTSILKTTPVKSFYNG